jgi:glycosyltransferase involved in cell wall biosynthesis
VKHRPPRALGAGLQRSEAPSRGSGQSKPVQLQASVVICAYSERRWDALRAAVEAALSQSPAPAQILLVIDHNESLLQRAREAFPDATVLRNGGQRGLSCARNSGVARATGDVVAFVDDDARPDPGWLAAILAAFDDETVIGAGGVALPLWEESRPNWFPVEFLWVVGCSYRGLPQQVSYIRNPLGATMAFRRELFDLVGGFTDGIGRVGQTPLGCEETEFAIRAASATGGRILHIPEAIVEHLVPRERTAWRYFYRRCFSEGVSKARVARSVGRSSALSSERRYVLRTLPSGAFRGLRDATEGDLAGLRRALAILAGLTLTCCGYVLERLSPGTSGRSR